MRRLLALLVACHAEAAPVAPTGHGDPPPAAHPGGRKVVTETEIEILDPIHFVGAQISQPSFKMLDAIAKTLINDPDIKLLELQANATTQALADVRARACATYLVGKGVSPNRLRPVGMVGASDGTQLLIVQRGP